MNDVLRESGIGIARRNGNSRRSYLLVNSRQAKHIPTSPSEAWNMMASLAKSIGVPSNGTVVVSFAETATAIGAVVASEIGDSCFFIHSTRAKIPDGMVSVNFDEHHSHAVEHHLFGANLFEELKKAERIVLIDDEFTTGNTLINAIESLEDSCRIRKHVDVHAASIINRMSGETLDAFRTRGVRFHHVIEAVDSDTDSAIRNVEERGAQPIRRDDAFAFEVIDCRGIVPDPRMGVAIGDYRAACERLFATVERRIRNEASDESSIAVLGTEECMFPSLMMGRMLESSDCSYEVRCHSTTRSPICISTNEGYPIANGFELRSVYDAQRRTFLYNLRNYDLALVVSDAKADTFSEGAADLACAIAAYGCDQLLWVAI